MSRRARHLLSILILICMPVQALAAIDATFCAEMGTGNCWGVAVASDDSAPVDQHENLDFGIVSFDACGLCHLGCAPVSPSLQDVGLIDFPHVFVPTLGASRIEHDSPPPLRPPRSPFA